MSNAEIIEFIKDRIDREYQNLAVSQRLAGNNSPGYAMTVGAIEAYKECLELLEQPQNSEG